MYTEWSMAMASVYSGFPMHFHWRTIVVMIYRTVQSCVFVNMKHTPKFLRGGYIIEFCFFAWQWSPRINPCFIVLRTLINVVMGKALNSFRPSHRAHLCVGKLSHHWFRWWIAAVRCQAIIWSNAGLLLFGNWGTHRLSWNFYQNFEMRWKMTFTNGDNFVFSWTQPIQNFTVCIHTHIYTRICICVCACVCVSDITCPDHTISS